MTDCHEHFQSASITLETVSKIPYMYIYIYIYIYICKTNKCKKNFLLLYIGFVISSTCFLSKSTGIVKNLNPYRPRPTYSKLVWHYATFLAVIFMVAYTFFPKLSPNKYSIFFEQLSPTLQKSSTNES